MCIRDRFEGKQVESVGLIKMDFLGLKTLSIIKDALENIEASKGVKIDIDAIPLDDSDVYKRQATISPPRIPAFGPTSMIQSALRIISSSCSTTMTEFPASRKALRLLISLILSR